VSLTATPSAELRELLVTVIAYVTFVLTLIGSGLSVIAIARSVSAAARTFTRTVVEVLVKEPSVAV